MFMTNLEQNLTVENIKTAQWLQAKKPLLRRLLILVLILVNLIIWTIAVYQTILFIIYTPAYRDTINGLTRNWVNFLEYNERVQPNLPVVSNETLVYLGQDNGYHYTFVAEAENDNNDWAVSLLEGKIVLGNQTIVVSTSLLPNEKKYLLSLNQTTPQPASTPDLEITRIAWRRVRPELRSQLEIIHNLSFQNINFIPSQPLGNKIEPARLRFNALNQSAYSFWEVKAQIVLYQNNKIVDVYVVPITNWLAGKERSIEINLSRLIDFVSTIKIIPDVNLLDTSNFINP